MYYVGSTINYRSRLKNHFNLLRNNKHSNKLLQNDFNCGHRFKAYCIAQTPSYNDRLYIEYKLLSDKSYNIIGGNMDFNRIIGLGIITTDDELTFITNNLKEKIYGRRQT